MTMPMWKTSETESQNLRPSRTNSQKALCCHKHNHPSAVFEMMNHLEITCFKRYAQELLEGAMALRLEVISDVRTSIFIGLDNCGYKLTKHFLSKSNKNKYMNIVNHVAAVFERCPPASTRVFLPSKEWKDMRQFRLEMLLPIDSEKENEICQSC